MVFIRGGNYIASDMLLSTSEQRYRDEVRMHAEVLQPSHASGPRQELHTGIILHIRHIYWCRTSRSRAS